MKNIKEHTIGELVAEDYRTAAIFSKYQIDFCCKGNRMLAEACTEEQLPVLYEELQALIATPPAKNDGVSDFKTWPLDLLAEYIEKKHHRFVSSQIPVLSGYIEKICSVHGQQHPELLEIRDLFKESAGELSMHMKKEELMLFPYIKRMCHADKEQTKLPAAPFGTVQSPIRNMMHEHDAEGERFNRINLLSGGYVVPADGCNTYQLTYALLKAFEEDLHLHIHLENNILFPGAIQLEERLSH